MIRIVSRPVTGRVVDLVKRRRSFLELDPSPRRVVNAINMRTVNRTTLTVLEKCP
ncbi:hypothetical protein CONLIGDRAFT_267641 [Coniochaeta ligniaria NRRL 30616]|uniref:Uncharacterized protein n=1 Tax=Coniochaeta ligniaria NRRL 30616 TaxID=1408157 RepID=A0A1J7IY20_9PEZI|nr:hypothetical protein CONLIGDRAFT_267641 [Coniochaeta ligniaria NRRL 30616]